MNKPNQEYEKFDRAMTELLKVPRSEIKAALEAEKAEKKKKRKPKMTSASDDRVSRAKD